MRGKWHGTPFFDLTIKKHLIAFEVDDLREVWDKTKDKELSIEVKEWREKRSLNANSYFHVLVGKLADVLKISRTEVHNWLIAEYGQTDLDAGIVILEDRIDWKKLESLHLLPIPGQKEEMANGRLYQAYYVRRGSHTYDTKEMSILIDGAVYEAKEQGIETLPPAEIERLKNIWQNE